MEGVRRHICASSTHTPSVRFSTSSCRILRELVIGICRSAIAAIQLLLVCYFHRLSFRETSHYTGCIRELQLIQVNPFHNIVLTLWKKNYYRDSGSMNSRVITRECIDPGIDKGYKYYKNESTNLFSKIY